MTGSFLRFHLLLLNATIHRFSLKGSPKPRIRSGTLVNDPAHENSFEKFPCHARLACRLMPRTLQASPGEKR